MSTSLLYHGWDLRGYRYVRTSYEQGLIRFSVEQDPATFRCSACGSLDVMKSGVVPRRFCSLPIGKKPVVIELPVQRLWCAGCGKTRQAKIAFADAGRQDAPGGGVRYADPKCTGGHDASGLGRSPSSMDC